MRPILYLFCCFLLQAAPVVVWGQESYTLHLHRADSSNSDPGRPLFSTYTSAVSLVADLQKLIPRMQEQGYLSASIDSLAINGNHYEAFLYSGRRYSWAMLRTNKIPEALFTGVGIDPKSFTGRPLNPSVLSRLCERILDYCETNGYPFARVWLEDAREEEPGRISASLNVDQGELRRIDTVIITGSVAISRSFLLRYLDLQQGSHYNEKKLRSISQHIRELPFIKEQSPWQVTFKPGETRLTLALEERKANQLNALLGLMPNNLEKKSLLLTADIQLALQNLLGHGEIISASYQNLQYRSPRMKAELSWPYLFGSPIGMDTRFDLFRNDLQFRKLNLQAGLRYQFSATDYARVFYQLTDNRIISIDTPGIITSRRLPDNIDARSDGPGLELSFHRTDYRLNPHKGGYGRLTISGLQRRVIPNNGITGISDGSGFDYSSLYDTLAQRKYQYFFSAEFGYFLPLGKAFTLKLGYSGGYIAASNIFRNELFQLGGFRLLRGFDEQSIFSNQYHIAVTELRLHLSAGSYAYLFSDNAWVQSKYNATDRSGIYNGFGLGTTLETKSGVFTLAYALGHSDFNPLRFRESKLLFGYIALF